MLHAHCIANFALGGLRCCQECALTAQCGLAFASLLLLLRRLGPRLVVLLLSWLSSLVVMLGSPPVLLPLLLQVQLLLGLKQNLRRPRLPQQPPPKH